MITNNETPNQEQDQPTWGAFADMFGGTPEEATTAETAEEGVPQELAQPVQPAEAPAAPTQPEPPAGEASGEDDVPRWSGQEEAGRSFKEIRDRERQTAAEAAYWRGQAEALARQQAQPQQQPAQQPAADPEPNPEEYTDTLAYLRDVRAWDRRQLEQQFQEKYGTGLQATEQQVFDLRWDNAMLRAQQAAGEEWKAVVQYANGLQQVSEGFKRDLAAAADPGQYVLEAYRLATGRSFNPAPQQLADAPPAQAPAAATPLTPEQLLRDPKARQELLNLLAAEAAAKGETPQIPQNQGPRGVGSSPGAVGVEDGTITPEQVRSLPRPQLNQLGTQVFSGLFK